MRIEFLMCGSPTDAFWSQAAIFRRTLTFLGEPYSSSRFVLCLGAPGGRVSIPTRWSRWFRDIEVRWANEEEYRRDGDGAQAHELFRLLDATADLSLICDADTLLIKPLPTAFFDDMRKSPAICGVLAHYPPPLTPYPDSGKSAPSSSMLLWDTLADQILGGPLPMPYSYSLVTQPEPCPFYINHGFVAGPPTLLRRLGVELDDVLPVVRSVLDNDFYDQIGIPFAIARGGLPCRVLPMRYNFPNDPRADERYPDELEHVVLMHYLRTTAFDRHCILADTDAFSRFMSLSLTGSNRVFQDHVRRLTDGQYPWPHS
jgi:hypothetical protein